MNTYHSTSIPSVGTPSHKFTTSQQTPTNKISTTNLQYQTVSSVPTYQYMTMTQMPSTSTTTTLVNSSSNALAQSTLRSSQQFINPISSQNQTGIIGQPLTVSSHPVQLSQQNINSVTSPRFSVQATSPTNNTSDLAQSIINRYKQQQQQPQPQLAQPQIQSYQTAPTQVMSPIYKTNTINNFNSAGQTIQVSSQTTTKTVVNPVIEIPISSPTMVLPQSPIQAKFFQTESSTKTSTISQQNVPSYMPYTDANRNASNYIPSSTVNQQIGQNAQLNTSHSHPHFSNLTQSYNNLNTSHMNNLSRIPDKVSDKLIDEFQKLTETNLKFFMQNKQKWKEIEESLKHENEELKSKISILHESYSQINRSMVNGNKPEISFSLQKDLDLANVYEQKVLAIQKELERSHFELEEQKRKNEEAQIKNEELNKTCEKLNEHILTTQSKQVESKSTIKVDELKIEEVKQQYEIKLNAEKQLYNQAINSMSNQIAALETSLINEKFTNQKLQSDQLNSTSEYLLSSKFLDSKNNLENANNDFKVQEIKQQYDILLNTQKEQFNSQFKNLNSQIADLESSLTNEKFINKKLQNEIQNLSTLQAEQSRIIENKNILDQSILDSKIQGVRKEYEDLLSNQKIQYHQDISKLNTKMTDLELQLINEKTTVQKLNETLNQSTIHIEQIKMAENKSILDQSILDNKILEVRKEYDDLLSNKQTQYNYEINKINAQKAELEVQLLNEKSTIQKLQNEILSISQQQIQLDQSRIYEVEIQHQQEKIAELKTNYEQTLLNQKTSYDESISKMNVQIAQLENVLSEEKVNNQKLQSELQNMSVHISTTQSNEVEINNLKKQVEELHNQNLKINLHNMELTQTQLVMAQLANQSNNNEELQKEIDNLKMLNETLNLKNEELIQINEKVQQEKNEEQRLIIQKMEQENFSVIQHIDDRQEKEVRNMANNMDSILFENQIEELNETIRQLQQQLNNQHEPAAYGKQISDSPDVARIFKREQNQINVQEHFVNQEEEDAQKDIQQEIVTYKEEITKQKEAYENLNEQFKNEHTVNEQLQQELEKQIQEFENVELRYKKQISEIESKLFLHTKEISEKKQLIEELEKSKKQLSEQVFSYGEKEQALHKQLVEAKEEINKIQSQSQFKEKETEKHHSTKTSQIINEHEMQINKLKSEISQTQSEYTIKLQQAEQTHASQLSELTTQIQNLTSQIQTQTNLIEEKQKQIEEQVNLTKKLEERVSEMVKEREELIKHDKDIEVQSKQLKEIMEKEYKIQIEGYLASIQKLESEIESHQSKYQSQIEVYNDQVKKNQDLELKLKTTQEKQSELELQWNNEKQQIQNENHETLFQLKTKQSELEKIIAEKTHIEHDLKTDLEKYQNQLAQVATLLSQKETQLTLFKKENSALSTKIQEIEEDNNQEKLKLTSTLQTLQTQHKELEQKYEKQVKQYERIKNEKEENDLIGNEEIQKLKMNYDALLESERHAKDEIKKEFIYKVDELKIQVAKHDTKNKQIEEKHQKQVKILQKEIDGLNNLNDKKIEAMKTIQENCNKFQEEKEILEQQLKKKEQSYAQELKTINEELEVAIQEKKKLTESKQQLQEQFNEQKQKIEQYIENQEKLTRDLKQSEEKRVNFEKESTLKHQQTIKEYETKISEKNIEFEKILSTKQGDSSQQMQELTQKIMKQEKELRDKENSLSSKISDLQTTINEQELKLKTLEEEKIKITTQFSEKISVFTKEIESQKILIKENQDKIEAFEREIKEKVQMIKKLESENAELEEKNQKQEDKIVLISTHLEQTKASKKETEDKLLKKLKEKETEQNIITSDYNDKIKIYKQTIEQLQSNSRAGEINFSQDLKFSQISKITDNLSDNNSQEHGDKFSGKEMSSRFMGGGTALSQSRASMNSVRSKEETRSMYKKLTQMSMATAAMMSAKRDYISLKELAKSIDDQDTFNSGNQQEIDPRLTKSEIHK